MGYVPIKVWVDDGAYEENPNKVLAEALRATAGCFELDLIITPLAVEKPPYTPEQRDALQRLGLELTENREPGAVIRIPKELWRLPMKDVVDDAFALAGCAHA